MDKVILQEYEVNLRHANVTSCIQSLLTERLGGCVEHQGAKNVLNRDLYDLEEVDDARKKGS